jgi:hypothetical protein
MVATVAPPPAGHQAAGELVDDHHLTVFDHVVGVELEDDVRAQCLIHVMKQRHVGGIVKSAWLQPV